MSVRKKCQALAPARCSNSLKKPESPKPQGYCLPGMTFWATLTPLCECESHCQDLLSTYIFKPLGHSLASFLSSECVWGGSICI